MPLRTGGGTGSIIERIKPGGALALAANILLPLWAGTLLAKLSLGRFTLAQRLHEVLTGLFIRLAGYFDRYGSTAFELSETALDKVVVADFSHGNAYAIDPHLVSRTWFRHTLGPLADHALRTGRRA
ncbi:MAG TPA: hypothetical protein VMW68_00890 [Methyloceanibacter sp.]|nr:hypothetical protein [Methyloceanibacter sp.]